MRGAGNNDQDHVQHGRDNADGRRRVGAVRLPLHHPCDVKVRLLRGLPIGAGARERRMHGLRRGHVQCRAGRDDVPSVHVLGRVLLVGYVGDLLRWHDRAVRDLHSGKQVRWQWSPAHCVRLYRWVLFCGGCRDDVHWHRSIMRDLYSWKRLRGKCGPAHCVHLCRWVLFCGGCRDDVRWHDCIMRDLHRWQRVCGKCGPADCVHL